MTAPLRASTSTPPATAYKQKVWDSGPLTLGDHEIKIWWDTANASGKYITADAFDVKGSLRQAYLWHRYEQTDIRLLYTDTWSTVTASGASGGSYKQTSSTSAYFDFVFSGRQCDWIATTGPAMGKALVSVDGGAPVTVDLSERRHALPAEGLVVSRCCPMAITGCRSG